MAVLHSMAFKQGGMFDADATTYIKDLQTQGRYV